MLRYSLTEKPPVRPKRIRFGLLSAEEIANMAVCKVTETTLYYRGLPASGGLLDPLMGTVDRRHRCASCMRESQSCQGHAGYIQLAFPAYHIGYMETVLRVLRSVCFACARVCVDDTHATGTGKTRLNAVYNAARTRKTCPHCEMPRPSVVRTSFGFRLEWPEEVVWESEEERAFCTKPFTARDALSILEHIPDEDVELLGLNATDSHPKNMIFQNMVVPPVCCRPAIYSSEGSRSRGQSDLTVRLLEILKRNNEVAAAMQSHTWQTLPDEGITTDLVERIQRLQYEVFMLINSNARVPKPPGMGRGGSSMNNKCLHERLKGKEGRVRGNLMGKRTNQSARAVITPDAYFEPDRIGVPYKIAMVLTIPETVNTTNIAALSARVRNGASHVHGAKTVIHTDGTVTDLAHCRDRDAIVLRPRDVVERHLADDDVVVFNRQPSLHMYSMMGHRVRLMPGNTLRLALPVAGPYNADFDGDEMNVHVPQSKAAATECMMLMGVAQNCIGAQSNKPMMGIVQDSLLGCHKLSVASRLFDHAHTCRLLQTLRHREDARLPPPTVEVRGTAEGGVRRFWTGKQIFSAVLPPSTYVEVDLPTSAPPWEDADLPVIVRGGRLLCGLLRKSHVGTGAGGIVDVITREHGGVACMRFMGDLQRLTHAFLLQCGHHVGVRDVMLCPEAHTQITERLHVATRLCEEIQRETVDASPDVAQTAEKAILRLLSKTLQQTGSIVNQFMDEDNGIRCMVSGANSKGSFINLSQIGAALGQQSLEGKRIVAEKGTRTLPCFAPNDLSLASRGMVFNSFALGLSPSELFYHAVGGREGLVDTAVKTSQSGYLQRRLNKAMEDTTICNDGTLRNTAGDIVSFLWGSDGMQPTRLERCKLGLLLESEESIRARMTAEEARVALESRAQILMVKQNVLVADMDARVLLPFHPQRVERLIKREVAADPARRIGAAAATEALLGMLKELSSCHVVCAALVHLLCGSRAGEMDASAHADLLRTLRVRVLEAKAPPGESVGCIAAQSVGEPTTQLTLNTFHTAGCAEKNVTLGIPRIKELVDVSKSPKTSCTTVRFRAPYGKSRDFVDCIAQTLPLTRLGDIVRSCEIVFDPDPRTTVIADDAWMVRVDASLGGSVSEDASSHILRLHLSQETMATRQLTPPIVRRMLAERLRGKAHVTSSETNAVEWVVRIRFDHVGAMARAGGLDAEQEAILCHRVVNVLMDTVVISGHPDVSGVDVAEEKGEYVVHAYGNFLSDCVASPTIDWVRTTSDDVWNVYTTLGVEACAHVLFEQMKTVLSFDGGYIDDRHIMVIVDHMLRAGTLMPLNRHGINRTDQSPLMRASFEETSDILYDAALFTEEENAAGVTTSIMTGQLSSMGTGTVQVLFPSATPRPPCVQGAKKRIMRSTCRSHCQEELEETVEYVMDPVRSERTRPLSPQEQEQRKRPRFRPMSPTR